MKYEILPAETELEPGDLGMLLREGYGLVVAVRPRAEFEDVPLMAADEMEVVRRE